MPLNAYWASACTGGGTGALDKLEGTNLADKDMALLLESTDTARFWWLDDDASGSEGETVTNPDTSPGTKSWLLLGLTLPNTGLHILDTNSSHDLIIKPGSDVTADRTFTLTTGDADRTLTLSGNSTLNQDLQTTDTPTFGGLTIGSDGSGGDALLYGATASNSMIWDASENVLDIASTMKAADNVVDITVTDATTLSSGYGRGAYIDYTVSGSKSGSYAINGLGIDMTISEACPTVAAMELYTAAISNKTIGNLYPFSIYCEDIGTGVGNFMAVDIGINSTNTASSRHTGMRIRNHAGTAKAAIMVEEAFTDTILRHSPSGVDLNLITLDNSSSGIFYWDDSEQSFRLSHKLIVSPAGITIGNTTATNLLIGTDAGNNDEGANNVMIGYQAGYNNDTTGEATEGENNTYIGYQSGYGASGSNNTGRENVGVGYQTLYNNSSGIYNFALGTSALTANTIGYQNLAIGGGAMRNNISGYNNIAIGTSALYGLTSENYNIAIGRLAIRYSNGGRNVAIGYHAGFGVSGQDYERSVIIGHAAGEDLTTGDRNTLIGYISGNLLTTGANNVCVGYGAGDLLTTGSSNIIIGYDIDPSANDATYELNIGNLIKGNLTTKNLNIVCNNDEVVCNDNEVVFNC